jgi:hypothetical protein
MCLKRDFYESSVQKMVPLALEMIPQASEMVAQALEMVPQKCSAALKWFRKYQKRFRKRL